MTDKAFRFPPFACGANRLRCFSLAFRAMANGHGLPGLRFESTEVTGLRVGTVCAASYTARRCSGDLEAEGTQGGGDLDQGQADQGGRVVRGHAGQQREPGAFGLETAGAVERFV